MADRLVYQNPVFPRDFPDPFVLKYRGEYWAYCTGYQTDGRVFGILRSRDLVNWQEMGSAMEPLPGSHSCYWAPEVTYDNGRFYLYYSVGDEEMMHIRVATAIEPAGPFIDQGVRLTQEPFAIDAHAFTAPNGTRYLFYATDFLAHDRIGTGTVMARLLDPFTLAGQPRPVSRARHDWQIYDPQRAEKAGVRWHTLEGPFVLERKGIYYQMFSGGNWQNPSYGVSYATTRDLETPDEWAQACDGERVLPILRTIPGQVLGPGHNSVVRGPDNRQFYCVYHRWGNGAGRQLAVDPLDWAGERMLVLGPSHTPQAGPLAPTFADYFDRPEWDEAWSTRGRWRISSGIATAEVGREEIAKLAYDVGELPFVMEVSARGEGEGGGSYGLILERQGAPLLALHLSPDSDRALVLWADGRAEPLSLTSDFRWDVFHLIRAEIDGRRVAVHLDERVIAAGDLSQTPTNVSLFAEAMPASFSGFALTAGWQDCFDGPDGRPASDWASDQPATWAIRARQLIFNGPGQSFLWREPYLAAYELVVNARLNGEDGVYGIAPVLAAGGRGPLLTVERAAAGWVARWRDDDHHSSRPRDFPLPAAFDPFEYQQFRFRKEAGWMRIQWEQHEIASLPVTTAATAVGLYADTTAAFDMARVTAISL